MLRYTIGDSLFFAGMKAYATDTVNFRLKNANRLVNSSSTPRRHWNLGWAVRSKARPRIGSMVAVVTTA